MATKPQILRKLQAYKKNPELIKEVSNTELADLVLIVMRAVETIEQSMESKRVDVENKYDTQAKQVLSKAEKDSETLLKQVQAEVNNLINKGEQTLGNTATELEKRVQQAIENIRNGEDGIVSDEEIERAATIAASLIELPDFEGMMTKAIQGNGALIRDALESLAEGDEQLAQEAVRGLVPRLQELQERIERISTTSGGTIGKNQVYGFIAQAIADGTIPTSGGSSTFTALTDTPAGYTSQGGKLVRVNTAEDALEFIDPPSGSGDVSGPASAVNEQIPVFDGVTGKLIKDGGATVAAIRANTANVTAAGALMDSEVTNLAQVKAFNSADYATAAQGTLADNAIPTSQKGAANGVAELDAGGLVPAAQLPSFVDDVIEVANFAALPATGETGKIYVTLDTNLTYRWSGSAYVEISASLALGETSSTAYRGDRGKTAYDHSQVTTGNPHNVTKAEVGLGNVPNVDARARSTHTGTQTASTISDFDTEVANNSAVATNTAKVSYPGSADATELNILDGATVTTDELNILDGVTATTAEINKLDGVAGDVVGTTDTQTMTNKTLTAPTLTGTTTADRLDYDQSVGTVLPIGNLGATETFDWSAATHFTGTLDANITFDFSNAVSGQKITVAALYSGAQRTLAFTPTIKWAGGAAPTGPDTAGQELVMTFIYLGTTYYGSFETFS